MNIHDKNILFLSPHTDDVELQCGGLLTELVKTNQVYVLAFSNCLESVPHGLPLDTLEKEFYAAMRSIPPVLYELENYPVRNFIDYRQDILEKMRLIKTEFNPNIVFIPCGADIHQDHQVIHNEALRAFRDCCIVEYITPKNCYSFQGNWFHELTQESVDAKVRLISHYESQQFRTYFKTDHILNQLRYNGGLVNKTYCEHLNIIRWID